MNAGAEAQVDRSLMGRLAPRLPLVLILAATVVAFLSIRDYGLMGYDSYPLILTARIQSLGDFWGTFSESMMDGRYHGDYYRPLLNLSFAADYGLFGLQSWGYQLTGALLFGATAAALWLLARRLLDGGGAAVGGWGALVTLLFFLLHDSQFEVVPVPARRPEMLCALFTCVALWVQLRPHQLERRWPFLPALFLLAAAASKETGYVMPAVACLAVFLYSPGSTMQARGMHALRAGVCHGLLIGGLLGLRVMALGGLGGPADLPPGVEGPGSLELSQTLLLRLLAPQNFAQLESPLILLGALAGLVVLLAGFCSWRNTSSRATDGSAANPRRAAVLAVAWIAIVCLLYGISRSIEQWYLFLPVVGMSLLLGAGAALLIQGVREGSTVVRGLSCAGAVVLASFMFFQVRYSPLYHDYPEYRMATAASDEFLEKLAKRIEATAPGQHLKAPPLPMWYPAAPEGPAIRGAAILEMYSVQAWVELSFPERKLRVLNRPTQIVLDEDESVIQLLRPKKF